MQHLILPKEFQAQYSEAGKALVYKLIMHKVIGVKLYGNLEGSDIMIGRVHFPSGDIASEILKAGFAKLNIPKDKDGIDTDYLKTLK